MKQDTYAIIIRIKISGTNYERSLNMLLLNIKLNAGLIENFKTNQQL